MEFEINQHHLVEELTSLEREFGDLESTSFSEGMLDPITIDRVQKRKEWVKDRLDSIRAELYPEVVA